ncbi:hypothetical protein BDR05DRAFT_1003686 [Suillus weaverae]|nr:hypothetical protein BDR05DRAFT_1003686 [Suillus weaverae]
MDTTVSALEFVDCTRTYCVRVRVRCGSSDLQVRPCSTLFIISSIISHSPFLASRYRSSGLKGKDCVLQLPPSIASLQLLIAHLVLRKSGQTCHLLSRHVSRSRIHITIIFGLVVSVSLARPSLLVLEVSVPSNSVSLSARPTDIRKLSSSVSWPSQAHHAPRRTKEKVPPRYGAQHRQDALWEGGNEALPPHWFQFKTLDDRIVYCDDILAMVSWHRPLPGIFPDSSFPDANGTSHRSVGPTSSITIPGPPRGRNQRQNVHQEA